ncbi:hypothetical protein IAE57_00840 [Stenotrophomonas sp. S48]|uniref:hypothetical protein n=1 Tax=unclassified Stenotrophomonas TaxID=196198 RepID=UPI001900C811|nr:MULTISPECIES: hypothetical protein [unclassified Stenotrophomonas]MBK0024698.1 hypothetical protein [Stenotrophomonas sp. S48]MBK0046918.1 hypothetical protein [Stenotrophomonas sp. S49]
MKDTDQLIRDLSMITEGGESVLGAVDTVQPARLGIVSVHGWSRVASVAQDGADAARLLVQHADTGQASQRSFAGAMKALVATGQVKASNEAYL